MVTVFRFFFSFLKCIYLFWLCWAPLLLEGFLELQWAGAATFRRGLRALEHGISRCSAQVYLLFGMWDLPKSGIKPEPGCPALARRFLATGPSRKFLLLVFEYSFCGWPPLCLLVSSGSFQSITWVFLVDSSAICRCDFVCLITLIPHLFFLLYIIGQNIKNSKW